MKQSQKITIGVLIIVAALASLMVFGFGGNTGYQMTITEILAKGPELEGKYLLVEGAMVPGSVQWDGRKIELRFTVTDGENQMPVLYNDVAPDNFEYPDTQIILKGKYDAVSNTFLADKVETRCPSTYEAVEPQKSDK